MKRLLLLAVSAYMALVLSGCGDNAEKKVETQSTTTTSEQPGSTTDTTTTTTPTDGSSTSGSTDNTKTGQ